MNSLTAPSSSVAGSEVQVTWKTDQRDVDYNQTHFTLFLMDRTSGPRFLHAVLASDVDTRQETITVTFPVDLKNRNDYYLAAVQPDWVDRVYNSTPVFTIKELEA